MEQPQKKAPRDYAKFGTEFDWENTSVSKDALVVPDGILDGLESTETNKDIALAGDEEHAQRILKLLRNDHKEAVLKQEDFSL
ncbi:MAG: hypothetical protein WCK16_04465 [Candidatus Moraniibacteriota bacterium]